MANRIMLNETSYHGAGAIKEIANEAKARAFKKAFVCSDPDLIKFQVSTKVTDLLVPVMAVIYVLTVVVLVVCNFTRIPWFFQAVFGQAFSPDAVFGGAFGTVLSQGIKRGLMSNEAGQGTITMPAAAADANHPCDQGCVQALGVFLDTIVICTLTGFVVIMGRMWLAGEADAWFELGKLEKFLASCRKLFPQDGYFMKYQGDLFWKKGLWKEALSGYARARECTNNGIVHLSLIHI